MDEIFKFWDEVWMRFIFLNLKIKGGVYDVLYYEV